jgi:hypothetical protein
MITKRPLPGVVQIDRESDMRFRKWLLAACAPGARVLMKRALDAFPQRRGRERSTAFFGLEELDAILARTNPVVEECEKHCPGIAHWLTVTGYANEPAMIKAFAAWAEEPLEVRGILQ